MGTGPTSTDASAADGGLAGAPTTGPVRVLVADDNAGVRQALADLIAAEPSLSLVGTVADADAAIELTGREAIDVAVLDVRMPGGGDRAARGIRACSPRTRVVAFSAHGDPRSVVGMVGAGAVSYLLKGTPGEQIVDAIHRAADGQSTLSREATGPVVGALVEQLHSRERELHDRQRQRERVDHAMRPGALSCVYQPVVDLRTRRRLGVEALARFDLEPYRTPDRWFADAWEVGLGLELELLAVRAALPALDRLGRDEFLSVNISPAVATSPRFAEVLPAGSHGRLVIEITEHAPVHDYDTLAERLEEPRRAGLRLAVDDAGAGYASLRHILRLSPDIVKLDMSLTRSIEGDRARRALVAALVPFAAEIGATVVAEGVETEADLVALRAFGAGWGQGYLLGRPAPLAAVGPAMSG